jgi:glycerol-3-phosphate O-acyltransferase
VGRHRDRRRRIVRTGCPTPSTATAQQIQVNINRAADVNPINLLALALLSTPKHAMGEADLLASWRCPRRCWTKSRSARA